MRDKIRWRRGGAWYGRIGYGRVVQFGQGTMCMVQWVRYDRVAQGSVGQAKT